MAEGDKKDEAQGKKPVDERAEARRALKRAIAAAKRDPSVKKLSKTQRRRAGAALGRKTFRQQQAAKAAAAAAKPAAPAPAEAPKS